MTGNFFQSSAPPPRVGRTLTPSDELGAPAIVLSHRAWSRHRVAILRCSAARSW